MARRFFDVRFFAGFGAGMACTLAALAVAAYLALGRVQADDGRLPVPPLDEAATLGAAGDGLQLRTLDGEPVGMEAFAGRPVVVNLWATWCGPCLEELPTLQALHADPPTPLALVVASDEPAETIRAFMGAAGYTVPVYRYDAREAPFEGELLPTTYVLDREGRVVLRHVGAADWNAPAVRDWLADLAR